MFIISAALILSAFILVIEKIAWKRHQQRNLNVFLNWMDKIYSQIDEIINVINYIQNIKKTK